MACEALQIFSKNANQWRARPLPAAEISAFRHAARESGIRPIVAHASYLINVATPKPHCGRSRWQLSAKKSIGPRLWVSWASSCTRERAWPCLSSRPSR